MSNSALIIFLWLLLPLQLSEAGDTSCLVPASASTSELEILKRFNCAKVHSAFKDIPSLLSHGTVANEQAWTRRLRLALVNCEMPSSDLRNATQQALTAWGKTLMDGRECCNSPQAPYCASLQVSKIGQWAPLLIAIVFAIVLRLTPLCSQQLTAPRLFACGQQKSTVDNADAASTPDAPREPPPVSSSGGHSREQERLRQQLVSAFLSDRGSPLRELPAAEAWGTAAAELYAGLCSRFGFQADNAQNQFDHLLSLWRSHAAIVADRAVSTQTDGVSVDERTLLSQALQSLHAELLEGFIAWREKMGKRTERRAVGRESRAPMGGLEWTASARSAEVSSLGQELAEVAVYLLVWGEAGNIRFMPEVCYFLVDLVLSADEPLAHCLQAGHSGAFLASVLRPLYNTIFDEIYDRVSIDGPVVEIAWADVGAGSAGVGASERLLSGNVGSLRRAQTALQPFLRLERRVRSGGRNASAASNQAWTMDPVGYDEIGRRMVRIRWAASLQWCMHVEIVGQRRAAAGPRDNELRVELRSCVDGDHRQHFVVDDRVGRVLWAPTIAAQSPLCLSAAGSRESSGGMRVQLRPLDLRNDAEQRFVAVVREKKSGKDLKHLKEGFQNFLPPDASNYDDWNELFNDPDRLEKQLVLSDGVKLFDLEPGARLAKMRDIDWRQSLARCKTHRELHSWWGVFASTHRVWLLHGMCFVLLACWISIRNFPIVGDGAVQLAGNSRSTWFATVGLIAPIHALCWRLSIWFTSGHATRDAKCASACSVVSMLLAGVCWVAPLVTYTFVRITDADPQASRSVCVAALAAHAVASISCLATLLLYPGVFVDLQSRPAAAPWSARLARWLFWLVVFGAKLLYGFNLIVMLTKVDSDLLLCRFFRGTWDGYKRSAFTTGWDRDAIEWTALWATGFLLFIADTQLWFTLGCTFAGALLGLSQRSWRVAALVREDTVAALPARLSEKLLPYTGGRAGRPSHPASSLGFSRRFPRLWDRIVAHWRYEDVIDDHGAGELTFCTDQGRIDYQKICAPLPSVPTGRITVPDLFRVQSCAERCIRRDVGILPDPSWPKNTELQWRLVALGRSLSLSVPRPFRAPYIPGLTVLIPHYGETIVMSKAELLQGSSEEDPERVPLITWLERRYALDFQAFTNRMLQTRSDWPRQGTDWADYKDEHWDKICMWASMRNQTLWRTVAGMMLYYPALDCHFQLQGDEKCALGKAWDPTQCFTCIVSMQQYAFFNASQLSQVERMLNKFPSSLKIAYIDYEERGVAGDNDSIHPQQQRRYYSCLTDKECELNPATARRMPKYRVELPGFPILGDGKGDNQNHAIPFSRGSFIQCIDANQGAYFEQMFLLPSVLGEFRHGGNSDSSGSKKIVGFPERITSDIGSVGDFAASAEFAFGTVLQRSYAALGGRMHYGHPDMMSKAHMMQQGGVSKATKTVNLSEDIFAGMDFTLRGSGRQIVHREYFHVAKGRDMGFATVLQFFSKLSAGSGEVVLTRQCFRLGQFLSLPEFLTFHYAHVGFYLTQYIMSRCPVALVFLWLLVLVNGAEKNCSSMDARLGLEHPPPDGAEIMASMLSWTFSWLLLLFCLASAMPFIVEMWMQQGISAALGRYFKQLFTLAPLHFIFQAKTIGIYVTGELRTGGAQYIATGRGLPTERRPFVSRTVGLYKDFAQLATYDGWSLLLGATLATFMAWADASDGALQGLAWWWIALALTVISWLFAPFIFNPYQFAHRYFRQDVERWRDFFFTDGGCFWQAWYEKTQLRVGTGLRVTTFDVLYQAFLIGAWYTALNSKLHMYGILFPGSDYWLWLPKLPPVFASLTVALIGAALEPTMGRRYGSDFRAAPHFHLALSVACCVILDVVEAFAAISFLISIHWWRAAVASMLLKYFLLSLLLSVAEHLLRLGWYPGDATRAFLRLWLYGHRMAGDLASSGALFLALSPLVLFDRLRSAVCQGCSLHHLLVFRALGQRVRTTAEIVTNGPMSFAPQVQCRDVTVEPTDALDCGGGGAGVMEKATPLLQADAARASPAAPIGPPPSRPPIARGETTAAGMPSAAAVRPTPAAAAGADTSGVAAPVSFGSEGMSFEEELSPEMVRAMAQAAAAPANS